VAGHLDDIVAAEARTPLAELRDKLRTIAWTREEINATLKSVVTQHKLKLPKIAMPLRVMVTGEPQTPSIDAVLVLLGRDEVIRRMDAQLPLFPQ